MPTSYFIITNDLVRVLVDSKNYKNLDIYLDQNVSCDILSSNIIKENKLVTPSKASCRIPFLKLTNNRNDKIYHIISYAVESANNEVLNYYNDVIECEKYRPDGNSFNLLHLAIENYVKIYSDAISENMEDDEINVNVAKRLNTIILLLNTQMRKYGQVDDRYILKYLLGFCNDYQNYYLMNLLIEQYNILVEDIFHCSILWNYPKVFDYIVDNYKYKITFDSFGSTVRITRLNGNKDMISHVLKKFKETDDVLYYKYRNLLKQNNKLINN